MSGDESFDAVVSRLGAGDQDAAAEIFRRYAHRLIHLARSRLDSQMRQKIDPEDVLQSVFRSFFLRQATGQFDLDGWGSLWSLLVRITLRKCGRQIAAFHADRRDVGREMVWAGWEQESRRAWEAIDREPTPEEVVSLTETVENLMRKLDGMQQRIVELRLQGYTVPEISQQVGRTERTVHRVLSLVRDGLTRLND